MVGIILRANIKLNAPKTEMPRPLLSEVVNQVTSALRDVRAPDNKESESADPLVEKKRLRHLLHVYCYLSSLGTSTHYSIYELDINARSSTAQCRYLMIDGLKWLSELLLRMTPSSTRDESDIDNRVKELCYWTLANLALGIFATRSVVTALTHACSQVLSSTRSSM